MSDADHPALARLLNQPRLSAACDALNSLSGTDLTSFLLASFEERAAAVDVPQIVRRYGHDRFVVPSPINGLAIAQVEVAALTASSEHFETVALAPLVPFGTHHVLGATPQNNVVSTSRGTEVAADPTTALALEAAVRRSAQLDHGDKSGVVRLAAVQRVTRAQHFEGPRSFAHFSLLGLTTAGRDRGNLSFEHDALQQQITALIAVVTSVIDAPVELRLSSFSKQAADPVQHLADHFAAAGITAALWPDREHGRDYYRNMCFKLDVLLDGERYELGDGGDVWWMRDLLQNQKERLVIAGIGLERLALLIS